MYPVVFVEVAELAYCFEGNLGIIITYWLQTRPRRLCLRYSHAFYAVFFVERTRTRGEAETLECIGNAQNHHGNVEAVLALLTHLNLSKRCINCHCKIPTFLVISRLLPCSHSVDVHVRCTFVLCEVLSTLHAGDSFGELSLLYNIRREAREMRENEVSNHPKTSEQRIVTHVSSRNFQKVHLAKRARQRSEPSRIRLCLSGAELAHSEMASMQ